MQDAQRQAVKHLHGSQFTVGQRLLCADQHQTALCTHLAAQAFKQVGAGSDSSAVGKKADGAGGAQSVFVAVAQRPVPKRFDGCPHPGGRLRVDRARMVQHV